MRPDGSRIAHTDKNQRLWLYTRETKSSTLITSSTIDLITSPAFSSDGKMLAWVESGANQLRQIHLEDLTSGVETTITSSRYDSSNPTFSPDGHWLYFLSDRTFVSSVGSPWGTYGPQPYFDHRTGIFALALQPDLVSPFQPWDELRPKPAEEEGNNDPTGKKPKPNKTQDVKNAESGLPDFDVRQLYGLLAPAGTSRDIVRLLNEATAKVMQDPEAKQRLLADGSEVLLSTPDEFEKTIIAEIAKWTRVIKRAGITPNE